MSFIFLLVKTKSSSQFTRHWKVLFQERPLNQRWSRVMIESIDEEVFGRCCEFVYSGDYSTPCPVPQSPRNGTPQPGNRETQCQEEANRWDSSSLNWNLFHPKGLLRNYDILLAELAELGHTPRSGFEKDLNNDPFTSYAAVFLSHAEIHRFGFRTGWLSLILLSFYTCISILQMDSIW